MSGHNVYLAVPGKQFCWGTTTGVITATKCHTVRPFNAGLGFSGVVDFNWCWTDAQNLFESGEITHFAMLHGDIEPDPEQNWLDILLDEMERRDAELVSAHSPIKDHRGLTSSGICNLNDRWNPFRRFTQKEILNDLPETFNNVTAGYPDKPLLHNTGCWVADLRKPIFRDVADDGSLKTFFRFPEQIVRGPDGRWQKQQESEDWLLSRELWERGARNTWITSRVRLTHHGYMSWPNWIDFGTYKDGDEATAINWRPEQESLPFSLVQMLEFELGTKCNLGHVHHECPNMHPERYGNLDTSHDLDDETIVRCAAQAYRELGFTGLVGWIYYNEPLLQADRMFRLMAEIKSQAPAARFILWTNGMLIPEECEQYRQFEQIVISGYNEESRRGMQRLGAKKIDARWIDNPELDNRLVQIAQPENVTALVTNPPKSGDQVFKNWDGRWVPENQLERDPTPCLRPFVEFIIDAHGNTHLCCYDWQGKGTLGNVITRDFAEIAHQWRAMLPNIAGQEMSWCAPEVCQNCGNRWGRYQQHDERIVERARRWRASVASQPKREEQPA